MIGGHLARRYSKRPDRALPIKTSTLEQLLKVKMLDVIALKAGNLIEQPAGSALFQYLLRSRSGVKPALRNRFVQDPGKPGFGLGVVWPALTIDEIRNPQTAALPCFDLESPAHASAPFSKFE